MKISFLISIIFSIQARAAAKEFRCEAQNNYPSIQFKSDEKVLTTAGEFKAKVKGIKRKVKVISRFASEGLLELTIDYGQSKKTLLMEVKTADQAAQVWDGAGTFAYGPEQAEEDFKKLFGALPKKRIFTVQQFSKKKIYPSNGGFCALK